MCTQSVHITFIKINFSVRCMVWPWCCLLQHGLPGHSVALSVCWGCRPHILLIWYLIRPARQLLTYIYFSNKILNGFLRMVFGHYNLGGQKKLWSCYNGMNFEQSHWNKMVLPWCKFQIPRSLQILIWCEEILCEKCFEVLYRKMFSYGTRIVNPTNSLKQSMEKYNRIQFKKLFIPKLLF